MLDFEELSILEKVGLAALIVTLKPGKQTVRADQLVESSYTPTPILALQLINQLIEKRYLSASFKKNETYSRLSITDLNKETFLRLNIPNQRNSFIELLNLIIKDSHLIESSNDIEATITSALIDECRLFVWQAASAASIKVGRLIEVPPSLLELLALRPLSEIFLLLQKSLRSNSPLEINFYQLRDGCPITFDRISQKALNLHLIYAKNNQELDQGECLPIIDQSSIMLVLSETIFSANS